MTATTTAPRPPAGPVPLFAGVLRSAARTLGTVRSTFWALLAALAFNVGTAALRGTLLSRHPRAHHKATIDSARVSLGAVLRSSGGAVAVLFGVLFVPTLPTALLPSSSQDTLGPYLPMHAGDTIYTIRPEAHLLGPWAGFGVFCLYAAAALAAGF